MKQKKILYFECSSGISGDMVLGALLDLGVDREKFLEELEKLHLDGYRVEFETVERNAVRANHVRVVLTDPASHHGHEHDGAAGQSHTHEHPHGHDGEMGADGYLHEHHLYDREGASGQLHMPGYDEHAHIHGDAHGEHREDAAGQFHMHSHELLGREHMHEAADMVHVYEAAGHAHTETECAYKEAESTHTDTVHTHKDTRGIHSDMACEPDAHADWEAALHHHHAHRSFREIREIIGRSDLKEEVKALALRIFTRVAHAEAKVHGKSVEEVHFHEVGAVDSIVDIVGCAILIDMIGADEICASVVQDGHGFVRCQHGLLSVPVPAVSEIFAASDVIVRQIGVETELVTPTGAAVIAELADTYGTMPQMKIEKIGWGAGTKILPIPNVLKVYLGSREEDGAKMEGTEGSSETETLAEEKAQNAAQVQDGSKIPDFAMEDEIMVLETNLDDSTGEMLGYAMEKLLAAGALDVFYTPIFMKKNRPAYKLTVLARPEDAAQMEQLIFCHTTTIGIRRRKETRAVLKREKDACRTPYGELEVKRVSLGKELRSYPEYESAVRLAESAQVPLVEIYENFSKIK